MGECDITKPKIALIGEAPGEREHYQGKPFVGPAGGTLKTGLSKAGLLAHKVYKMNVINCRPPKNKITSEEATEAIECCTGGFLAELRFLKKKGVTVFMPLGNTALTALSIDETITKARGSVYLKDRWLKDTDTTTDSLIIIPTFHPSFVLRGQKKEEGTWVNDFEKAKDIAYNGYTVPKEHFTTGPTFKQLTSLIKETTEKKDLIGVDIETTGFNTETSKILVIGIATSGERAFSIPFFETGLKPTWTTYQEKQIRELTKELVKTCPSVFQNALFDVLHLRAHGFTEINVQDDIMLLHHAIHPELPHNLGYITSIYGKTPYWKGEVLNHADSMALLKNEELRPYNLRDSAVLLQILPSLREDLKEIQTEDTYQISLSLVPPVLTMMENGIKVSEEKLKEFEKKQKKTITEAERELLKIYPVHPYLNLSSDDDLRFLFFNRMPQKVRKAQKELRKYKKEDDNSSLFGAFDIKVEESEKYLKKNTKKYHDLVQLLTAYAETEPFLLPKGVSTSSTDSGKISVAQMARVSLRRHLMRQVDILNKVKNRKPHHYDMKSKYERELDFLSVLEKRNKAEKLRSTYTDYKIQSDGRIHPSYIIHGTATGRLCVDPETVVEAPRNLNEPPKRVKDLKKGDLVYSFDEDRELCIRKVMWVGPTKKKPTLIIHTDKGPPLTVSREHLVRKRRGEWVHAKDLKVGDRLLCMPPRGDNKVTAIMQGPTKQLWDLEVEDTHCFIGNDIALHNSSRNPNFQNQPEEVKEIFVPEPGYVFVTADYSNLELRVMAVISEDDVLQQVFDEGKNAHDENTRTMFAIDKDHKGWHTYRHACKTYIFGRMYGGGLEGIYKRIIARIPEIRLTFNDFKKADAAYFNTHPKYREWRKRIEREVAATGYLRNAFGRIRIFLGSSYEVIKEALNFPIQSTAADILNFALIDLFSKTTDKRKDIRLVGTVHDSIILEVKEQRKEEAVQLLKGSMEKEVSINGKEMAFPVEIETGYDLKNLHEVQ